MRGKMNQIKTVLRQGGNVPGGHLCILNRNGNTFITPMKECNSIELKYTDIVVDIGCYVGTYSIRCARFPVCKITAYEPTPSSFAIMEKTPLPNLENIQAAIIGDNRKFMDLHLSKGIGVTNSLVESSAKPESVRVRAINYKDAVKGATIVKIDIEGGEYDIPVTDFIQDSMRAIIVDFHPVGKDWIQKAEAIISEIESHGFVAVVKPIWDGTIWTRAGSWIRNITEPTKTYDPMLNGSVCCGCGFPIYGTTKSICIECAKHYSTKHRKGYEIMSRQE
jgi:FkbM family methyltransferase